MATAQQSFAHRPNTDGSYDSICPTCYRTIATEKKEIDLIERERRHACAMDDLGRRKQRAPAG